MNSWKFVHFSLWCIVKGGKLIWNVCVLNRQLCHWHLCRTQHSHIIWSIYCITSKVRNVRCYFYRVETVSEDNLIGNVCVLNGPLCQWHLCCTQHSHIIWSIYCITSKVTLVLLSVRTTFLLARRGYGNHSCTQHRNIFWSIYHVIPMVSCMRVTFRLCYHGWECLVSLDHFIFWCVKSVIVLLRY
jgi:hypothetical protein